MHRGQRRGTLRLAGLLALVLALIAGALWWALTDDPGDAPEGRQDDPAAAARDGTVPDVRAPGGGGDPAAVRAEGPGELSGRIVFRNDRRSAAGQRVLLFAPGEEPRETSTDADGSFRFEGLSRSVSYRLEVNASEAGFVSVPGIRLRRQRRRDLGELFLAPSARVVVDVVASTGEPVPGAEVRAYPLGPAAAAFESGEIPEPGAVGRTGGDGRASFARLSVGTWNFVVEAQGFARRATDAWELQAGAGERRFSVTLDAAQTLTGVVRDQLGRPVPGVLVAALRRTLTATAANAPLAVRARTDRDGVYRLGSLPRADLVLWTAREGEPFSANAAVRLPGVERLDLTLGEAAVLTGVLLDGDTRDGLGDADIELLTRRENGIPFASHVVTAGDGSFEARFPNDCVVTDVSVSRSDYRVARQDTPVGTRLSAGRVTSVTLTARRGATVEGTVRADDGPVVGATITAELADARPMTAVTDGAGFYRLEGLPPGGVRLALHKWGYVDVQGFGQDQLVQLSPGRTVVVDVTATRGSPIEGVVESDAGVVAGAEVYVEGDDQGWRARSGDDGRFVLPASTPGQTVTLAARAEGFGPGVAQVTPPRRDVRIRLHDAVIVRGRLRSRSNEPLADAYVQVAGHGGGAVDPIALEWAWLSFERWSVRPDGTFEHEVPMIDSGFVVHAAARGLAPASSGRIALEPGRTDYSVDLVLDEGVGIAGSVVDTAGKPVGGAQITVVERPPGATDTGWKYVGALGPAVAAVSSPDGAFAVTHLPEGNYGLEATCPGHRPKRVMSVAGTASLTIVLAPIFRTWGRVSGVEGRHPAQAVLLLEAKSGEFDVLTVPCDATGRFDVELPARGAYFAMLVLTDDEGGTTRFVCEDVEAGATGVRLTPRPE